MNNNNINQQDSKNPDQNDQYNSPYSPSFRTYYTNNNDAQIIRISNNNNNQIEDNDFEFILDSAIQPVYPVFDRNLIGDYRNSLGSSSAGDDLDDVTASGSYCLWAPKSPVVSPSPSPSRCTKSNSTGSVSNSVVSRSWRLRNLLRRCKSDGKEGLVLVGNGKKNEKDNNNNNKGKKEKESMGKKFTDFFNGLQINNNKNFNGLQTSNNKNNNVGGRSKYKNVYGGNYYYENRGLFSPGRGEKDNRRRSYLPYKRELLGFFGSPKSPFRN